jgi:hypothetical protein
MAVAEIDDCGPSLAAAELREQEAWTAPITFDSTSARDSKANTAFIINSRAHHLRVLQIPGARSSKPIHSGAPVRLREIYAAESRFDHAPR